MHDAKPCFLSAALVLLSSMALAYAALLLIVQAPRTQWVPDSRGLKNTVPNSLAATALLHDEWRRFKWELGQKPPAIEGRDQP